MTDHYSKFTRAIPLENITANTVSKEFVDEFFIPYKIPYFILTDYEPQFAAKFFEETCGYHGVNHFTITGYN